MFNFFNNKTRLSQDQAYQQLQNDHSIRLIDVRSKEEFREGHIAHAVNVPLDQLERQIQKTVPNKDDQVFVVCLSGSRATSAVNYLSKIGYTHVFNIGGVATWKYGLTR
ncbi:Thiosulfate sulfurtransferase GlpE [bioreactor metagenome]|uniref:Thiosulfate sulfurtransferase GlpE n=1 Tax=bioreactor metagenome TaxID=1076179 RepID=A0A645F167_9ZZZZ